MAQPKSKTAEKTAVMLFQHMRSRCLNNSKQVPASAPTTTIGRASASAKPFDQIEVPGKRLHSFGSLTNACALAEKITGIPAAACGMLEIAFAFGDCEWHAHWNAYVSFLWDMPVGWENSDGYLVSWDPDRLVVPVLSGLSPATWPPSCFHEVKSTEYLNEQVARGTRRYFFDESTSRWRSPTGELIARELFGCGYLVLHEHCIHQSERPGVTTQGAS